MNLNSSEKPKPKLRKGLWSPEEDRRLRDYVLKHCHSCWSSVPVNAGLQRNGKSCRLRWINYLRPGLKRGMFTTQEEETILSLHRSLGNKWSRIAQHLPGRTDNEIKNYWHTYLKKKLATKTEESPSSEAATAAPELAQAQNQQNSNGSCNTESLPPPPSSPSPTPLREERTLSGGQGAGSFLPKIFFTEWLQYQDDDEVMMGPSSTHGHIGEANLLRSGDRFGYSANTHQDHLLMRMHEDDNPCKSDGSFGGALPNGKLSNNGSGFASGFDGMYGSQLKVEDQIITGHGFLDTLPGDDLFSLFNLASDVNFIYT